jgi:hypothetical protein
VIEVEFGVETIVANHGEGVEFLEGVAGSESVGVGCDGKQVGGAQTRERNDGALRLRNACEFLIDRVNRKVKLFPIAGRY